MGAKKKATGPVFIFRRLHGKYQFRYIATVYTYIHTCIYNAAWCSFQIEDLWPVVQWQRIVILTRLLRRQFVKYTKQKYTATFSWKAKDSHIFPIKILNSVFLAHVFTFMILTKR